MKLIEKQYNPFIRKNDSTSKVMTDVIIVLIPAIIVMWFAYGFDPIMVVMVAVSSALLAEFLFNAVFTKDKRSVGDGSAIVTGILLACTIGPFTPLSVVAVGGATAVIFGKLLWGGIGKNRFNPALIGREFMVVLFPAIMNSGRIFSNPEYINFKEITIFNSEFWDHLLYNPSGAMGEYSPILLVIGGIYLLWKRRISWHIPFAMLTAFTVFLFLFRSQNISFTIGGLLLGTIYMATDMPTSSSTHAGKIYFGIMTGVCAIICLLLGATRGYFSYSILLMNAFVIPINWVFRPRTWGREVLMKKRIMQGVLLTVGILAATFALLWIHNMDALIYPVMAIGIYGILRFALSTKYEPFGKIKKMAGNRFRVIQ